MDPVGVQAALFDDYEGTYCPASRDTSGRLVYERRMSPTGSIVGKTLQFEPTTGEWCVGRRCAADGSAEPFGVRGRGFEVTEVSDFDGEFVPGGMGGSHRKQDALTALAALKKPKRPKPPKAPKLLVFEPEEPTFFF